MAGIVSSCLRGYKSSNHHRIQNLRITAVTSPHNLSDEDLSEFRFTHLHLWYERLIILCVNGYFQPVFYNAKATPPAKSTFFYTGLIQCAKCGKNYRRKTTATQVVWICSTFNTRGKKYCASKQIPESTLDALVDQVVKNPMDIKKIIADEDGGLRWWKWHRTAAVPAAEIFWLPRWKIQGVLR